TPYQIFLRTYERGVEGETLSCGTGAVAAAVAVAREQHWLPGPGEHSGGVRRPNEERVIKVITKGGCSDIYLNAGAEVAGADAGEDEEIFLSGPVKKVYKGFLTYEDWW
ncbi:MAG: hypothetical protein HQK53_19830, partial [Oligoflexia bacterium]|nr:hypothetical protein [Oligoflexia bacterium]